MGCGMKRGWGGGMGRDALRWNGMCWAGKGNGNGNGNENGKGNGNGNGNGIEIGIWLGIGLGLSVSVSVSRICLCRPDDGCSHDTSLRARHIVANDQTYKRLLIRFVPFLCTLWARRSQHAVYLVRSNNSSQSIARIRIQLGTHLRTRGTGS